jgi:peptide/nickel transport system permease protein
MKKSQIGNFFLNNGKRNTGLLLLTLIILFSMVGPLFISHNVNDVNSSVITTPPSMTHWLGTDEAGRDVLVRLMHGGRYTLLIGIASTIMIMLTGTVLGLTAGYFGGVVDMTIMRIADAFMCIPYLPLLIVFSAFLSGAGISPYNRIYYIVFLIGFLDWSFLARIVRAETMRQRNLDYITASEALGVSHFRILFFHILPNIKSSIIVYSTLNISGAILSESTLSFLGLGVVPPLSSWGQMIQIARNSYILQSRLWLWLPPCIMIILTVASINLLGSGFNDKYHYKRSFLPPKY